MCKRRFPGASQSSGSYVQFVIQCQPLLCRLLLSRWYCRGWTTSPKTADLWRQKTRVPGLSCGVVYVILRLAVLVELRLVTDTSDRQTDGHRPMASTADA